MQQPTYTKTVMMICGPPGCGKTTVTETIHKNTKNGWLFPSQYRPSPLFVYERIENREISDALLEYYAAIAQSPKDQQRCDFAFLEVQNYFLRVGFKDFQNALDSQNDRVIMDGSILFSKAYADAAFNSGAISAAAYAKVNQKFETLLNRIVYPLGTRIEFVFINTQIDECLKNIHKRNRGNEPQTITAKYLREVKAGMIYMISDCTSKILLGATESGRKIADIYWYDEKISANSNEAIAHMFLRGGMKTADTITADYFDPIEDVTEEDEMNEQIRSSHTLIQNAYNNPVAINSASDLYCYEDDSANATFDMDITAQGELSEHNTPIGCPLHYVEDSTDEDSRNYSNQEEHPDYFAQNQDDILSQSFLKDIGRYADEFNDN